MNIIAVEDSNGNQYKMGEILCESSMGIALPVLIESIDCNVPLIEHYSGIKPSDLMVRVIFSGMEDRSHRGVIWLTDVKRIVLKGVSPVEKW